MQRLHELRVGVVDYLAVADVEGGNLGHFLVRQAEIPDVEVLLHALFVGALGYYGHAALGVPAEGDLARALAVLFAYLRQYRVSEDAVLTLGKRRPGLRLHAVLAHEGKGVLLLEEGVQLHLVHRGQLVDRLAEVGQAVRIEVADAENLDIFDFTLDEEDLAALAKATSGKRVFDVALSAQVDMIMGFKFND